MNTCASCRQSRSSPAEVVYCSQLREAKEVVEAGKKKQQKQLQRLKQQLQVPAALTVRDALRKQVATMLLHPRLHSLACADISSDTAMANFAAYQFLHLFAKNAYTCIQGRCDSHPCRHYFLSGCTQGSYELHACTSNYAVKGSQPY